MFLQHSLLLLLRFSFLISGTWSLSTQDDPLQFSETPNAVEPISLVNASIALLNTSAENGFTIRCDGETYGYNPNIRDCEEAKENLMPDPKIWTLGERNTGLPPQTVPLPYRVMGDRGICYVQPVLVGDHKTGKASIDMIRRAAAAIIVRCATDTTSQGGIATNIGKCEARVVESKSFTVSRTDAILCLAPAGGDNNIAVTLGTYQQSVSCQGSLVSWQQCREILYSMPAGKEPMVFGPRSDPTVTRSLPIRINSGSFHRSLFSMFVS